MSEVSGEGRNHNQSLIDHEKLVREGPLKGFIEPRLLCLIKNSPSHGYQLIEELDRMTFPGPVPDSAAVYRMLRELERQGLAASEWKQGGSGPSRRVYTITEEGAERLKAWRDAIAERTEMLNRFIAMCDRG